MGKFLFIILGCLSFNAFAGDLPWHMGLLEYDKLNPKYDGQGVIVAVIDSGVDVYHPSLAGKMWTNPGEIPDNKIDDDNDGYVDDIHGVNFIYPDSQPSDLYGHGTHVAGDVAAEVDKETGAHGIAPGAKIMALKIMNSTKGYADFDQDKFLPSAAKAVRYAVDHGAKVMVASWRLYKNNSEDKPYITKEGLTELKDALAYANEHGVIFVNAVGNEGANLEEEMQNNPMYPLAFGKLPNFVSVGATTQGDTHYSSLKTDINGESICTFSNFGSSWVDVMAPGEAIYSTYLVQKWENMSGTSMAAPIVAGLLARGLSKGYTWQQAIEKLHSSSIKDEYWNKFSKYGRIDAVKFLSDDSFQLANTN